MKRPVQIPASLLLAYATWVVFKCPCTKTCSCHLKHYFYSVGLATALIVYENGLLF